MAARALKTGDSGADVKALQQALNQRAESRFYPPLATDSTVGPATMRAFQALGWALGLTERTLSAPEISVGAQRLIASPEQRKPGELARARQRGPALHAHTIAFDGAPTFWGLAKPLLLAREHSWDGQLVSSDRRKGVAERFGKKSQATLFDCAQRKIATGQCPADCGGDCAPANPPGASSHELRSDANGFPGPVGRQLKWFELGLDVSDSDGLISVLDQLGYKAHRTYPNSIPEHHHVNFTASPGPVLPDFGPASHPAHPATAHALSGHATAAAATGAVTLTGTDVSFNQPSVDWAKVKAAGHDFAMSRCTDGLHSPDPKFGKARWKGMKDAGLVRGAYHIGRPQTGRDPKDEVTEFLDRLTAVGGLHDGDLLPILDIEAFGSIGAPLTAQQTVLWVRDWVAEMKRRIGRHPIIYTGVFWRETMNNPPNNFGCPLWLAAYVKKKDLPPCIPKAWHEQGITIWQYSETGSCPGIAGDADLNRFTGPRARFDLLRM